MRLRTGAVAYRCRRLEGRYALVTGAARVIGRAVAVRFAEEGAWPSMTSRRRRPPRRRWSACARRRVPAAIRQTGIASPWPTSATPRPPRRWSIGSSATGVGSTFSSTTPASRRRLPEQLPLAECHRVMNVNLTGALSRAQAAIRHFLSRPGGGGVLNCTSVHEIVPKPGYLSYAVSKGGLGNLTRTLALEYADRGIRVNAVGPGATLTDMNSAWAEDPMARRGVGSHIPMGRAASAE
jgi:glucose 1-dehydrogenase